MTILNRDVFYLIIEELRNDKKTLISCLSVNKTFCEITVPILWKNPWKFLKLEKKYKKLLLNVIISHFSDETKNYLRQCDSLIYLYERPLFNYISFCKHLNFEVIRFMINSFKERSKTSLITNEILKLFINEDMKFSHLYIPKFFDYQLNFTGTGNCFSEIRYFRCSTDIKDNVLFGLVENCKSIKELEIRFGGHKYNNGIGRLIKAQKNLFSFSLIDYNYYRNLHFDKIIENALIKHSKSIYYYKITTSPTKILSSFVNLKILELDDQRELDFSWNYSLPHLQILRVKSFSEKGLTDLINSTSGSLIEIKIDYCDYYDCTEIIQAIYQNCPKLKYLKLRIGDWDIYEFEKILINCQYLDMLYVIIDNLYYWEFLFEILTKSSPISLFKFKFQFKFDSSDIPLEPFFDNWKGKCPILLSFDQITVENMEDLLKEYEAKGIIKNYNPLCDDSDDGFDLESL